MDQGADGQGPRHRMVSSVLALVRAGIVATSHIANRRDGSRSGLQGSGEAQSVGRRGSL